MFTSTDMMMITMTPSKTNQTRAAFTRFENAHRKAAQKRLFAMLTGRSTSMLSLSQALGQHQPANRHYLGLQLVSIDQIHGSEARTTDFDDSFLPLNERSEQRWVSIFQARLNDTPLPPVDLIKVGNEYFVRDGHHRISVAKVMGQDYIEAEVTEW